jgi:hypothetical protein
MQHVCDPGHDREPRRNPPDISERTVEEVDTEIPIEPELRERKADLWIPGMNRSTQVQDAEALVSLPFQSSDLLMGEGGSEKHKAESPRANPS